MLRNVFCLAAICLLAVAAESDCYLPIDVMFLQDTTGSFVEDLPIIVGQIPEMVDAIVSQNPNSYFGVAEFKDKMYYPLGEGESDFCYKLNGPLTSSVSTFESNYAKLYASGGGDLPEAQFQALIDIAKDPLVGWHPIVANTRAGAGVGARVVIMSTDAPPHLPGDMALLSNYGTVPQNLPANPGTVSTSADIEAACRNYDYPSPEQMATALKEQNIYLAILTPNWQNITAAWQWVNQDLLGQPADFYQFIAEDSSDIMTSVLAVLKSVTKTACASAALNSTELPPQPTTEPIITTEWAGTPEPTTSLCAYVDEQGGYFGPCTSTDGTPRRTTTPETTTATTTLETDERPTTTAATTEPIITTEWAGTPEPTTSLCAYVDEQGGYFGPCTSTDGTPRRTTTPETTTATTTLETDEQPTTLPPPTPTTSSPFCTWIWDDFVVTMDCRSTSTTVSTTGPSTTTRTDTPPHTEPPTTTWPQCVMIDDEGNVTEGPCPSTTAATTTAERPTTWPECVIIDENGHGAMGPCPSTTTMGSGDLPTTLPAPTPTTSSPFCTWKWDDYMVTLDCRSTSTTVSTTGPSTTTRTDTPPHTEPPTTTWPQCVIIDENGNVTEGPCPSTTTAAPTPEPLPSESCEKPCPPGQGGSCCPKLVLSLNQQPKKVSIEFDTAADADA